MPNLLFLCHLPRYLTQWGLSPQQHWHLGVVELMCPMRGLPQLGALFPAISYDSHIGFAIGFTAHTEQWRPEAVVTK